MAKKPTTRKSTAAKSKTAKKAAKPKKTARKAATPKKTAKKTAKKAAKAKKTVKKAVKKAAKKTAKKTAKAKKTVKKAAKRAKATAKKKSAKPAAAGARASATPSGSSDKDHLISVIQSGTGSSKKAAGETLAAVLDSVAASLKKNQKVQLVGFGTFDVVKRRARQGRNPATGAPIRIKASKGVRFKAGSKLKGAV